MGWIRTLWLKFSGRYVEMIHFIHFFFHSVLIITILCDSCFFQLFYYIGACALNNLLMRKEMCHWTKGIQIRFNVSYLEQWVREQHFVIPDPTISITDSLQPIIEAAQLLQARKTDDDVENVCSICSRLTSAQIVKLLSMYTPSDELEDSIPVKFIRQVETELKKRLPDPTQGKLLMDTKLTYTVRFPYSASAVKLEEVTVPSSLKLSMLNKV